MIRKNRPQKNGLRAAHEGRGSGWAPAGFLILLWNSVVLFIYAEWGGIRD